MMRKLFVGVAIVTFAAVASGQEPGELARKQKAQEKARALARELVGGVLEIQVRQLAENGLDKLPIHDEIADMKTNIAAVIDADGSLLGVYRKMHIPHDPLFEEKYYFAPGDTNDRALKAPGVVTRSRPLVT